jgi:cell division protein FtsQ
LQQVGTGPDIWRRASQSPAPGPALGIPAATRPRARLAPRRSSPSRYRRLGLAAAILAAIAFLAFLAMIPPERGRLPPRPLLAEIEQLMEIAGFGLHQVAVTGHRFTLDGDIFDAVDLGHARTLLGFDTSAAKARIERLPWVERASIERIIPDRLEVHIVERVPFAVWQLDRRTFLIDSSGHVLGAAAPGGMPGLPRIAGEGAPGEAAALHALLAAHPALLKQVRAAERIGERRWTLRLADGGAIELPATGESEALARAAVLMRTGAVRMSEIDLRVEGRTLLRAPRGAQERKEQATEAQAATGRS